MKRRMLVTLLCLLITLPGLAAVSVIGGLVRTKSATPGEQYEGVILLKNQSDTSTDVKIYQTDYQFFADGRNLYEEPGTSPRSNAKWMTVSPTRINIPGQQTASVYYKVHVPKEPALKGSYWSLLMIEPSPEPVLGEGPNGAALGLRQIIRTGIQVVTECGDAPRTQLQFSEKKIARNGSETLFEFNIENPGEKMLSPAIAVEVFQTNGASLGKFEGVKLRVYPGCSVRQRINLSEVPPGRYKAMLIGDNGDENVFGAQYDLIIEK